MSSYDRNVTAGTSRMSHVGESPISASSSSFVHSSGCKSDYGHLWLLGLVNDGQDCSDTTNQPHKNRTSEGEVIRDDRRASPPSIW